MNKISRNILPKLYLNEVVDDLPIHKNDQSKSILLGHLSEQVKKLIYTPVLWICSIGKVVEMALRFASTTVTNNHLQCGHYVTVQSLSLYFRINFLLNFAFNRRLLLIC